MSEWASWTARAVRAAVFRTFADEGRAPSPGELATLVHVDVGEVRSALEELHALHALVLAPEGDAIRMAHPFSAAPMSFVVRGECDSLWWGGCAWDSFGIVAAVGEELAIETQCPCCRTELRYTAGPETAPAGAPDGAVVRVPRPAREWWDDVVATCTHIRTFCSADHASSWAERTHNPPGDVVPLEQLWALAQPWYGDRLDPDWEPHPREHNQALLEQHGFTGDFWRLP
jgi:hypothetical protein